MCTSWKYVCTWETLDPTSRGLCWSEGGEDGAGEEPQGPGQPQGSGCALQPPGA